MDTSRSIDVLKTYVIITKDAQQVAEEGKEDIIPYIANFYSALYTNIRPEREFTTLFADF